MKPSIHGSRSSLLTKGTWVYDPSYHGPFLYFVTAGMFAVFGASDLVARLLPALFGVLLIPLVYCIYRIGYINRSQTLIVSLFLAISPDMVYFSRFLRHDIFMLFFHDCFLLLPCSIILNAVRPDLQLSLQSLRQGHFVVKKRCP